MEQVISILGFWLFVWAVASIIKEFQNKKRAEAETRAELQQLEEGLEIIKNAGFLLSESSIRTDGRYHKFLKEDLEIAVFWSPNVLAVELRSEYGVQHSKTIDLNIIRNWEKSVTRPPQEPIDPVIQPYISLLKQCGYTQTLSDQSAKNTRHEFTKGPFNISIFRFGSDLNTSFEFNFWTENSSTFLKTLDAETIRRFEATLNGS